ncbi:tyrosine-type recombinase/integrase, partial [Massilia sp. 2TAF26]
PMQVVTVWLAEVDAAASNKSMGTAIRMMFGAGLREAEAAGARWEWMDWERGTYTPGETKGREAVPVPLPAWLLEHLAPLRKDSGLIAPRADGNRFGSGFARRVIHIANQKSSVNGITPHRLRGSFATLLLEAGATLRTVQEVMRHKSPLTTMEYIESNMETVVAAQQRIAEKTGMLRRESG